MCAELVFTRLQANDFAGDLRDSVMRGYAQYCNVARGRLLQVVGHIIHKSALFSPEPGFRFYSLGPQTKRY